VSKEPKLYRVRIEAEVFVVANSEEEAEDFALSDHDLWRDDVMENADAMASVATTKSVTVEESKCLPWVDDELEDDEVDRSLTVKAWAELNDEMVERARREREFNAKQLNIPGT
jgi:hypothetical protein